MHHRLEAYTRSLWSARHKLRTSASIGQHTFRTLYGPIILWVSRFVGYVAVLIYGEPTLAGIVFGTAGIPLRRPGCSRHDLDWDSPNRKENSL